MQNGFKVTAVIEVVEHWQQSRVSQKTFSAEHNSNLLHLRIGKKQALAGLA